MILLNPQIKNIVTYNYDNFLSYAVCYLLSNNEKYFTKEEISFLRYRYRLADGEILNNVLPVIDIGNVEHHEIQRDWKTIPIYHVHGYIPSPDELQYIDAPSIVLSMDEYCSTMRDASTWRISLQEHFIRSTNSLFVGSSLTDLTTKRLMSLVSEDTNYKVFMLDAHDIPTTQCFNLDSAKNIFREIRNSYLANLGVNVIDCESGFFDLFSEIATIRDNQLKEK